MDTSRVSKARSMARGLLKPMVGKSQRASMVGKSKPTSMVGNSKRASMLGNSKPTSMVDKQRELRQQRIREKAVTEMENRNDEILNSAFKFVQKNQILGEGVYGKVILTQVGPYKYVLKKFIKEKNKEKNKEMEEIGHLRLWNALSNDCRQYITRPIRTKHPSISAQLPVQNETPNATVKHLRQFLEDQKSKSKKLTLNPTLQNDFGDWKQLIKHQLAEALVCLHSKGFVHSDLHYENILVVYELDDKRKINYLKLKLIDMGLLHFRSIENKPLVQFGNGIWNVSGVRQLVTQKHEADGLNQTFGQWTNAAYIERPRKPISKHENNIHKKILKPLGWSPNDYKKTWTRHQQRTKNNKATNHQFNMGGNGRTSGGIPQAARLPPPRLQESLRV